MSCSCKRRLLQLVKYVHGITKVQLMHLARDEELCGRTEEIILQQKAINCILRSPFVVHLAAGQMIENCTEAQCVSLR